MDLNVTLIILLGLLGAALAYILVLFKQGKKKEIYAIVKSLVNEAEVKFGSGTGALKYEFVVGRLYAVLPGYIKLFITEKLLDYFIETAVNELQEYLEKETEETE